jgi:hypothetical protein
MQAHPQNVRIFSITGRLHGLLIAVMVCQAPPNVHGGPRCCDKSKLLHLVIRCVLRAAEVIAVQADARSIPELLMYGEKARVFDMLNNSLEHIDRGSGDPQPSHDTAVHGGKHVYVMPLHLEHLSH